MKLKQNLINKYLDLDFIKIENDKIVVNPEIIKICSDYNSQEELVYDFHNNFSDLKNHIRNKQILIDLFYILLRKDIVIIETTDYYMEEFYYHSSLLDRLKSGALDDRIMRGSRVYYEILGILFTIPIYINPDITTVKYGIDKVEIPKRKYEIENELDAEFARGIMLYQLLNETLKEDQDELEKHLYFTGHLTAIKHYYKITDGKQQFTSEELQNMLKEYNKRETSEYSIIADDN